MIGSVEIESKVGDRYVLPAVERDLVVAQFKDRSLFPSITSLVLVNAANAVLTMSFGTVRRVLFEGEELWVSPV